MWKDATGTYVATRCQSYTGLILNRIVQRPQTGPGRWLFRFNVNPLQAACAVE
jgi:hypothetical protein